MDNENMVNLDDVLRTLDKLQDEFARCALRNNMSFTFYDTLANGVEAAKTRFVNEYDPNRR